MAPRPQVIIINGLNPDSHQYHNYIPVKAPKVPAPKPAKHHHHNHHDTTQESSLKITTQLFKTTQDLVDILNNAPYPSTLRWTHLKKLKYSGLRIEKPRHLVKYLVDYSRILNMEREAAHTRQATRFGSRVVVTDFAAPQELIVLADKVRRLRDQVQKYGVAYVFRSTEVMQQELDSLDSKFTAAIWRFNRLR